MAEIKAMARVPIEIGGRTLFMRASWRALVDIEQGTGTDLLPLFDHFERGRFGGRTLAVIITAGLQADDNAVTYNQVGEWIVEQGITDVRITTAVAQLFDQFLTAGRGFEDEKKSPDPNGADHAAHGQPPKSSALQPGV